jgi:UMF1 family MFS transporter
LCLPCALLFAHIVKKIESVKLISISIIGYLAITLFALQLDKAWEFWFLASASRFSRVGYRRISRSYFSQIIPKENANEFSDIRYIRKGAAFIATLLMGVITQITGYSRFGVAGISVIIALGYFGPSPSYRHSQKTAGS